MSLALAILIGFFAAIGLSHQEAAAQKHLNTTQKPLAPIKQKGAAKKITPKPSSAIAHLDGIQVKNLKG